MSEGAHLAEKAEPNLTPILDMVFQLITFFMLVVNFKTASLDMSLKLPVVGSAMPSDSPDRDVLVLNIDEEGKLHVYGQVKDPATYIASEAQTALRTAQLENPDLKYGDELPVTVVIRADRATPFHLLNQVIRACQANGFRKFQYRAMSGPAGGAS